MALRITFLLGKPPKRGTLLAEVADLLASRGDVVTLRLPHEEEVAPGHLADQDLVVHRGLRSSVAPLLEALDEQGTELCNPWPADRALRDRRHWHRVLVDAEIPTPPSVTVPDWPDVLAHAGEREVVAKALAGPGRGASVVAGTARSLPTEPPFPGPYLVEPRLPTDDTDRKLYVAGEAVRGLLKPSTLTHEHTTDGTPFTPEGELVDLALGAARALDGHLLGVDVIRTPDGPVVVDVNAFPGFRGVDGASALVAEHIAAHATGGSRP